MCGGVLWWNSREAGDRLEEVERRIHEHIAKDLPICYRRDHILIGDEQIYCSGRLHAPHKRHCQLQA